MNLKWLRGMALLEGTSLILLLFVAMPLKYQFGLPEAVKLVGPIHGVLFIGFNVMLAVYALKGRLTEMQAFKGFIASFVPFGTFIYKAKMLKSIQD